MYYKTEHSNRKILDAGLNVCSFIQHIGRLHFRLGYPLKYTIWSLSHAAVLP